jgi:hypothetical protein
MATVEEEHSTQFHCTLQTYPSKFNIIDVKRFSNWTRLLRATAFLCRYIKVLKIRSKAKHMEKLHIVKTHTIKHAIQGIEKLNGEELDDAQKLLFKKLQYDCYSREIKDLLKEKAVVRTSKIFNLNPILDNEGVVRVCTRLDFAPAIVDENVKRPILLDGYHPITVLIIEAKHKQFHHQNRETVINELRRNLWIPKIRIHVNKVISRCTSCAFHTSSTAT